MSLRRGVAKGVRQGIDKIVKPETSAEDMIDAPVAQLDRAPAF